MLLSIIHLDQITFLKTLSSDSKLFDKVMNVTFLTPLTEEIQDLMISSFYQYQIEKSILIMV